MVAEDPKSAVTRRQQAFGRLVEDTRELHGLTQVELARKVSDELGDGSNITQATISLWESGSKTPRASNLIALERALRIEPGHLYALLHPAPSTPTPAAASGYPDDLTEDEQAMLEVFIEGLRARRATR